MNDELKEWIRVLKFGIPSVISCAFVLGGFIILINPYGTIVNLKGMTFMFVGLWFFYYFKSIRLEMELKKHKLFIKT